MNKPNSRPWQKKPKSAETEDKPWKKKKVESEQTGTSSWRDKKPAGASSSAKPGARTWASKRPAAKDGESGERRSTSDRRTGSERRVSSDRRTASTYAKPGARTWGDRKPAARDAESRPWIKKKAESDQTGKPAWRDRKPATRDRDGENRPWIKKKAESDQTGKPAWRDRKPATRDRDGENRPWIKKKAESNQTGKPAWRDRKPAARDAESRPWIKKKAESDQTGKPAWRDRKPAARDRDGESRPWQKRPVKAGELDARKASSDRRTGSERRVSTDRRTPSSYAKPVRTWSDKKPASKKPATVQNKPYAPEPGGVRLDKLHKVLANQGLGARREIEDWIAAGRILVNGKLAQLGDRVSGKEKIEIDGRLIKIRQGAEDDAPRVLVYHKPEGEVCTRKDEEDRKTVFENLPVLRGKRWVLVGRLDINTSGLILLTTDGELANRLMHPSSEFEREYAVRILGGVDDETRERLLKGVMLEDGMASFKSISTAGGEGANRWFHVIVSEGRNRLVRRLWESQDLVVSRLMRVRYGNITLPKGLGRGKFKELTSEQIHDITQNLGEGGKPTPFTKRTRD
jgi:23S rRNA pseudouridine2605 synthase